MEAPIAWLVQTILATLLIDKLDAWIGQVGLVDDVEKLKSEVERIEMVIGDVRGRADGNRLLARSLTRLKELLYDADDVIDKLDYYRLQQQVQGVTADDPQGLSAAEQVDDTSKGNADMPLDDTSSSRGVKKRKRRSKAWENFDVMEEDREGNAVRAACKHCHTPIKCAAKDGTSGMLNHNKVCQKKPGGNDQPPNPSSAGDATETLTPIVIADSSSRKRRRDDEESAQITVANTYTSWDKAEFSNQIQKITSQLQDVRGEVSEVLKLHGSGSASSSDHHLSTSSYQCLKTSSLVPSQIYGRDAAKDYIKSLILEDKSDGVRVLPIVGIVGVGKTALAQLVYNDPDVESQFDRRIWVWVSRNFDEEMLTREMLDFVSEERHEGINSFAKLQEILKSYANSKRLLLIFDDVWDNMKKCRWDKLLAPFISGQGNGIVVLITTRNLSVAKRLGTLKPVKLGSLEHDMFWLLFRSHALGTGNYKGVSKLSTIGLKIAEKLKGNPLAAVSIGALLREDLTVDHWSKILEKEDWKSLGLSEGVMPALKLSYDQLPYHLQQCFSYCSIFPNKHKFLGKDLVCIWISQGFVKSTCLTKRLEETGWEYLTELVNLGFFQQVEQEEFSPDSQIWFSECGLMHDFARMVSRTECATIDGLQCNKLLPSIRHLSIVTDSAYNSKDQYGNIPRNEKFEGHLRNAVTSVSKLRTLVLLGHYDSSFLQVLQDFLQKAKNLRLLQTSATCADFNSLMCSLADPTHLRYLKRESSDMRQVFPPVLSKLYHLQVLDVGSRIHRDGINNLVSLRHLVINKGVCSSIARIGNMTSLQELHVFNVQYLSSGFEMVQLESMNELVQLGLYNLDKVETHEQASGARLGDKVHLDKLHLSWNDYLPDEEYASSESSEEFLTTDDGGPSSEPSMDAAREVLEGLEPHKNLKHLQICGYNGTASPTWLNSNISVTSLQTLHLDDCGGCRILPSLERLPFLRKLKLRRMQKVIELLVPSLEELVLTKMPNLEICTSVEHLSYSLRILQIKNCHALKKFDLFESNGESESRQMSWLPGVRILILRNCPQLKVSKPLPPSTTVSELLVERVSTLPYMEGSSSECLYIGSPDKCAEEGFDKSSDELRRLDDEILAVHNLRNLTSMSIHGCRNLTCISFEVFSHLVSLKSLEISTCKQLFSLDVTPEHTLEDGTAANGKAFPSLQSLSINFCGITGKWLCLLLKHAPDLEKLDLQEGEEDEEEEKEEEKEEEENGQPNRISAWEDSPSGKHGDALTGLAQDRLMHFPLNLISLKKINIDCCPRLRFNLSEEGFSVFTSLQELNVLGCPDLFSSLIHTDENDDRANGRCLLPTSLEEFVIQKNYDVKKLQPCFPCDITSLRKLEVGAFEALESLQLQWCTALKELDIWSCVSLTALEGLQSLVSLRKLEVRHSPELVSSFVHEDRNDDRANGRCLLLTSLEEFVIDKNYDVKELQPCFPSGITSLRKLKVWACAALESLQLQWCTALQELNIQFCYSLTALDGLQSLGSLRKLEVRYSDLESLQLQSCTALDELTINNCHSLTALEGLQSLSSLRHLTIFDCPRLVPKDGNDEQENERCLLPASLEKLDIYNGCSLKMLQPCFPSDVTSLKTLNVCGCPALESLKLRSCVALEELIIGECESLTTLEGLQSLSSLRYLKISKCPRLVPNDDNDEPENGRCLLPSSLETLDIYDGRSLKTLQPCFPSDVTSLKNLKVRGCPALESLQLRSCVALEELIIGECESLTTLEGLQFLGSLRHLALSESPRLPPWLESFSRQGYELCSRLQTLEIDDPSVLTTSFYEHLTSLRRLRLVRLVLTEEQGTALVLLKSLQQLIFYECSGPVDLPAGLHVLPSLKWLEIYDCPRISRLPEAGLPLSLEELDIFFCSNELADQWKRLATSKLNVKIHFTVLN